MASRQSRFVSRWAVGMLRQLTASFKHKQHPTTHQAPVIRATQQTSKLRSPALPCAIGGVLDTLLRFCST